MQSAPTVNVVQDFLHLSSSPPRRPLPLSLPELPPRPPPKTRPTLIATNLTNIITMRRMVMVVLNQSNIIAATFLTNNSLPHSNGINPYTDHLPLSDPNDNNHCLAAVYPVNKSMRPKMKSMKISMLAVQLSASQRIGGNHNQSRLDTTPRLQRNISEFFFHAWLYSN